MPGRNGHTPPTIQELKPEAEAPKKGKVWGKIASPRQLNKLQNLYYTATALAQAAEVAAQMAAGAGNAYRDYQAEIKEQHKVPEAVPVLIDFLTGELRTNEEELLRQVNEAQKAKGLPGIPLQMLRNDPE